MLQGGFSEIWLGEHKESGQQVAVKVVDLGMEDLEESEVSAVSGRRGRKGESIATGS